jgi:hypothetical protein
MAVLGALTPAAACGRSARRTAAPARASAAHAALPRRPAAAVSGLGAAPLRHAARRAPQQRTRRVLRHIFATSQRARAFFSSLFH